MKEIGVSIMPSVVLCEVKCGQSQHLSFLIYHKLHKVRDQVFFVHHYISISGVVAAACYGMNCVLQKFIFQNPNPQCDSIGRWGFDRGD